MDRQDKDVFELPTVRGDKNAAKPNASIGGQSVSHEDLVIRLVVLYINIRWWVISIT